MAVLHFFPVNSSLYILFSMIIWQSNYSKMDFKVKYILVIDLFNEINCQKFKISKTVFGRTHSKLFTNYHVSCKIKLKTECLKLNDQRRPVLVVF